jgi:hypothetical protein
MKPDPLKALLKSWAERTQAGDADLDALGARIRDALPPVSASAPVPDEPGGVFHPVRRRLAAAAAAAILLGAGALLLHSPRKAGFPMAAVNGAEDHARLTAEQLAARRILLEETEALFADHLRWVQLDAAGMHLELSEATVRQEDPKAGLVVRTVMLTRKENQTDWETVWSSDILTRAEEYVEVAAASGCSGGMELWVHPLPDGRYAVDLQFQCPRQKVAMPGETRILSAGRPERILTRSAGGQEFRIYQSVETLVNGRV